jgi:GH3 auxin-responsive promoter
MSDIVIRQRAFAARAAELKRHMLALKRRARDADEPALLAIVAANADTEFGRRHEFAKLRSIRDYQHAVPLRRYEDFAPLCERMTRGERGVLAAEPPVIFRRTSGTTGAAKYIPVTERSLQIDRENLAIARAGGAERFPDVLDGPDTVLIATLGSSRPSATTTPSGIPWLSYAEHSQAGCALHDGTPGTNARFYAADRPLEFADAMYARLRYAIEVDLRGIVTVNPSSVLALAGRLAEAWDQIADEVAAGTVLGVQKRPPDPRRADQLRALAREGRRRPRDAWPNLAYVHSWKSAACALYLPEVAELFAPRALLPWPYIASEGITAVHLDDHPTAGYLLPHGALFEFLDDAGAVHLLHELAPGATYELVHTAWNGFYRYCIGDRFRVDSLDDDGVPRLEFAGRAGVYSSFTGEKLTEHHVAAAVAACGAAISHVTCIPRWGSPPGYVFVVELAEAGSVDAAALARELDAQLAAHNDEYPSKRSSGRLAPAAVELVSRGTFARLRERLIERGTSPESLKLLVLQRDDALLAPLLELSDRRRGE